jgi:arsenate reductase-like glutaredoxin family protein
MYIKQGGGKIKRKFLLSVLFICGFALVLNMNFSSAATVNQTNGTVNSVATPNAGLTVASTIQSTANTTVKAATATTTVKAVTNTTTVKAAAKPARLVDGLTLTQVKNGLTRAQKFLAKHHRLPAYINYGSKKISIAKFKKILKAEGLSITSKVTTTKKTTTVKAAASPIVGGLTLAQVKDGLTRTQSFILANGRLPTCVNYGSTKITIAEFEKILTAEGLKLIGTANRPIYITSDNINNPTTDNARINSIIAGLKALGLTAYNMGLGPNKHDTILTNATLPSNAVIVDIYGGADAGLIKEMGSAWYKAEKGAKTVYSVFWPPAADITGLAFLKRAHDDNYDPASFTGLANPAKYLLDNGYYYIHSGTILDIINAIFYQAKM